MENPNFNTNEPSPEESSKKETGKESNTLKNKLQKAAAIGAVAMAAFGAEGCDAGDKNSDQELAKEALKVLEKVNQENLKNQEKLLVSYLYNLNRPDGEVHDLFHSAKGIEESKARAWDIVKKKGLLRNGPDGKINIEFKRVGFVPVEIKVNGGVVPVGPNDYSQQELNMMRRTDLSVESIRNTPEPEKTIEKKVNPDSPNKPFISNSDSF